MITEYRSFMGIPVHGDISQGATRKEQLPLEDLQPVLQALLDDLTIVEFGWRQYTPYFNDGDVCEFGVYGPWVRTDADGEDVEHYRLTVFDHASLGRRPCRWNEEAREYEFGPYEGADQARYERCREFASAVEGGSFETVLLDAFGDHAQVTVTRKGITVDHHDHD